MYENYPLHMYSLDTVIFPYAPDAPRKFKNKENEKVAMNLQRRLSSIGLYNLLISGVSQMMSDELNLQSKISCFDGDLQQQLYRVESIKIHPEFGICIEAKFYRKVSPKSKTCRNETWSNTN